MAVNVTALAPMFEQSNVSGETVLETIAQLSVLLLSISAAVIEAVLPLSVLAMSWQIAVGGIWSVTVTLAVQPDELPEASAAVKVALFAPRLEQSNRSGTTVLETIAQLSLLLSSTSAGTIEAVVVFNDMVIFLHIAVGGVSSSTVTMAMQFDEFPKASFTVSVALLGPTFEQSNKSGTTVLVSAPQSALLPPSTSAGVIEAELPTSDIVMF